MYACGKMAQLSKRVQVLLMISDKARIHYGEAEDTHDCEFYCLAGTAVYINVRQSGTKCGRKSAEFAREIRRVDFKVATTVRQNQVRFEIGSNNRADSDGG